MAYIPNIPSVGNPGLSDIPKIADNFSALRCNEIGPAEPSNLVAGMFWIDTTTNILKLLLSTNPKTWLSVMNFSAAGCPKAHIDTDISVGGTAHGLTNGHGGKIDADKLDGKHVTELLIPNYYLGNNGISPYASSDCERIAYAEGIIKEFKLNILPSTTIKTYFEMKSMNADYAVIGQIYRNGVAVGTLRTTFSTSYVGYTENIPNCSPNDLIQLYVNVAGAWWNNNVAVRNFRLLGTTNIEVTKD